MKPKTKFQKKIFATSQKLPKINEVQKAWAIKTCLKDHAVIKWKSVVCKECKHRWKENLFSLKLTEVTKCPGCGKQLVYDERDESNDSAYFSIVTTRNKMQIVRSFVVTKYYYKKADPDIVFNEVMQHYIAEDGKTESMMKPVAGMSYQYDLWTGGELEFRTKSHNHELRRKLNPIAVYPRISVLPILKRNGFDGKFHRLAPQILFEKLLKDSRYETMFKAGQFELLRDYSSDGIKEYWQSIKICIRNNYQIPDATSWFDHVRTLINLKLDIRNKKYVCPDDLEKDHRLYSRRYEKVLEAERLAKQLEEDRKSQEEYSKEKGRFFALLFQKQNITIRPLKSIDEFKQEGDMLHHCVYTNSYFKKKDSLILSARIDDKPIETIEISLEDFRIKQSRGLQNKATEYHDSIVKVVEDNMSKIIKISRQKRAS